MRIAVTGTGRCGTCTFYKAVQWCSNYHVGHESSAGLLEIPQIGHNCVEVSGHLTLFLHYLNYDKLIHVSREKESCVDSLVNTMEIPLRNWAAFTCQYSGGSLKNIAMLYYEHIHLMLKDAYQLEIDTLTKEKWRDCWNYMGCSGDFNRSWDEWQYHYNRRENRGRETK